MIHYLSRTGSTAMVLVAALTAPVSAQVDLRGKRGGSILSPMGIECLVLSDGGRAEIHVRNSTDQTLQAGRRVSWKHRTGTRAWGHSQIASSRSDGSGRSILSHHHLLRHASAAGPGIQSVIRRAILS